MTDRYRMPVTIRRDGIEHAPVSVVGDRDLMIVVVAAGALAPRRLRSPIVIDHPTLTRRPRRLFRYVALALALPAAGPGLAGRGVRSLEFKASQHGRYRTSVGYRDRSRAASAACQASAASGGGEVGRGSFAGEAGGRGAAQAEDAAQHQWPSRGRSVRSAPRWSAESPSLGRRAGCRAMRSPGRSRWRAATSCRNVAVWVKNSSEGQDHQRPQVHGRRRRLDRRRRAQRRRRTGYRLEARANSQTRIALARLRGWSASTRSASIRATSAFSGRLSSFGGAPQRFPEDRFQADRGRVARDHHRSFYRPHEQLPIRSNAGGKAAVDPAAVRRPSAVPERALGAPADFGFACNPPRSVNTYAARR